MKRRRRADGATLKAVGAAASVSPMTVSNVINGKLNLMSIETRQRVERAILKLRYRPHSPARSLRNSLHYSVGLVIVDDTAAFLAHPGHSQIAAGLSNFLNPKGYTLAVQGISLADIERVTFLRRTSTDALCAILSGDQRQRLRLLKVIASAGQPTVVFHEPTVYPAPNICVIRHDDFGGGQRLARLLLDHKCRKYLILIPERTWPAMLERMRGMKAALSRAKVDSCDLVYAADLSAAAVCSSLERYLAQNPLPDALLAGNDQLAIGALKYLKEKGLSVPEKVRLTGFNAFDFYQFTEPVLTSYRVPGYEMGQRAGAEIIKRLEAGQFSAREIVMPGELALGGSSG